MVFFEPELETKVFEDACSGHLSWNRYKCQIIAVDVGISWDTRILPLPVVV